MTLALGQFTTCLCAIVASGRSGCWWGWNLGTYRRTCEPVLAALSRCLLQDGQGSGAGSLLPASLFLNNLPHATKTLCCLTHRRISATWWQRGKQALEQLHKSNGRRKKVKDQFHSKKRQIKGRCAPLLATATNFTNVHIRLVAHSCAINSFGTISFTEFQSLQLCKLMGPIPIYTICIYKHVLP